MINSRHPEKGACQSLIEKEVIMKKIVCFIVFGILFLLTDIGCVSAQEIVFNKAAQIQEKEPGWHRGICCIAIKDMNGDGLKDIISMDPVHIDLWLNKNGSFADKEISPHDLNLSGNFVISDFNGDTFPDIAYTEEGQPLYTDGRVAMLINNGSAEFTYLEIDPVYTGARPIRAVDMDRDGDMDIVVSAVYQFGLLECDTIWYENRGNLQFESHLIDQYLQGAIDIDVGDIDQDGDIDILWGDVNASHFCWLENDGNQNFTRVPIDIKHDTIHSSILSDVDLDSYPDIVLSTTNPRELVLMRNQHDGTFERNLVSESLENLKPPITYDIDNDGDIDIINACLSETNDFMWWENDGNLNFTMRVIEPFFDQTLSYCPVDFNDDGMPDILAGNGFGGIAWWENQPHVGIDLEMPAHHFTPGSNCGLTATVFNHSPGGAGPLPMFIMLEVAGNYWFYPSWTPDIQYEFVAVPPGESLHTIFDPFTWPSGCGAASGVYFVSLFTKPDFSMLMGVIDTWAFSWGE